jgi:hypothetical protein
MGVNQGKFVLNGTTVYGQQPRHVAQFDTTILQHANEQLRHARQTYLG